MVSDGEIVEAICFRLYSKAVAAGHPFGTSSTSPLVLHAFHKSTQQITLSKSCDTLIVLSCQWLELKLCGVQIQEIIAERVDKARGREEQDAGKGLAQGRDPSQGKHAVQEGRRWIPCYKSSHICTFLLLLC